MDVPIAMPCRRSIVCHKAAGGGCGASDSGRLREAECRRGWQIARLNAGNVICVLVLGSDT